MEALQRRLLVRVAFRCWEDMVLTAEGKMVWQRFEPKPFDEAGDVDIQITHCGVSSSDLHTLRCGRGGTI